MHVCDRTQTMASFMLQSSTTSTFQASVNWAAETYTDTESEGDYQVTIITLCSLLC